MSATGGHQLVGPALLQVLPRLRYLRAFLDLVTMESTLVLLQTVLEIQGEVVHI